MSFFTFDTDKYFETLRCLRLFYILHEESTNLSIIHVNIPLSPRRSIGRSTRPCGINLGLSQAKSRSRMKESNLSREQLNKRIHGSRRVYKRTIIRSSHIYTPLQYTEPPSSRLQYLLPHTRRTNIDCTYREQQHTYR
jgi:hypothetical protein